MTFKEFCAKHYGSLSAGVFAAGLLAVLGIYGGGFSAIGAAPADPAIAEQTAAAPTPPVPASEAVPADPVADETSSSEVSETTEEDQDPLEKAMAEEEAKAQERREAVREEINKQREAAGLPLLPAVAEGESQE